ncbi:hypothetical protein GDO78_004743 [Eleutherodactylus coqui]|uniref:Secreted protein n=1 Tax=Eleutherodactylus coqui TaxID=57060 RepID=A0A8J6ESM9_ELECQ|nr:hypothetical protein GDO78_004743 [Eleutherodactylus coqui]
MRTIERVAVLSSVFLQRASACTTVERTNPSIHPTLRVKQTHKGGSCRYGTWDIGDQPRVPAYGYRDERAPDRDGGHALGHKHIASKSHEQ